MGRHKRRIASRRSSVNPRPVREDFAHWWQWDDAVRIWAEGLPADHPDALDAILFRHPENETDHSETWLHSVEVQREAAGMPRLLPTEVNRELANGRSQWRHRQERNRVQ